MSDQQLELLRCIVVRYAYEDSADDDNDLSDRVRELAVRCPEAPSGSQGIKRSWTEDEERGRKKKLLGRTTSILDILQGPPENPSRATSDAIAEFEDADQLRDAIRRKLGDMSSLPKEERRRRLEIFRRHVDMTRCPGNGPVHRGCATRLIRQTRGEDSVAWSHLSMAIGADIQAYSNEFCETNQDERQCDAVLTGIIPFFHENVLRFSSDMRWNLTIAVLVLIAVLSFLLFRRRRSLAMIAILPNVVAVFMLFTVMQVLDVPLDDVTILVLVMSSGLIVDDTIHVLCRLERNLMDDEYSTRLDAIRGAYVDTAIPVLMTSCVLAVGMFGFLFDELRPVVNFGILFMSVIVSALLADFVFLPAFLVYLRRYL